MDAAYVVKLYAYDEYGIDNLTELNSGTLPALRQEMILINAPGYFTIGSPPEQVGRYDNETQSQIGILNDYSIGKYEVSFSQYDEFAQATGRDLPDDKNWGRGDRPVINAS